MIRGIIYGLIDSDTLELRYVGQTMKPLAERFRKHKRGIYNLHLRRWLAKRPVSIIVLERDPADLDEAERYWIAAMRTQGARLLNLTDGGGGGTPGYNHTAATREKLRAASLGNQHGKGHKHTAAAREKMSAAMRGKVPWSKGKKHTPETRAKMSAAARKREAKRRERLL